MDSLKVGDQVIATNLDGIVDSGTSIMVGGANTIGKVIDITGGATKPVDCKDTSLPDVTFTINGKDYILKEEDYKLEVTALGQTQCMPGFQTMNLPERLSNAVIMGDVFMRKYLVHFDEDGNRVGFAPKK